MRPLTNLSMQTPYSVAIVLAVAVLGLAAGSPNESRSAGKVVALVGGSPSLKPPLHDVASDKKFFGPPFPADYPDDKRPVVDKSILNKLKGPDQPYPALQSKTDFDKDFVKDENSDKGAWKAQFEYDRLRKKLTKETADEKSAEDRASKEGHDVDDAQRKVDAAGTDVDAAKKGVDSAKSDEAGADKSTGDDVAPSTDSLEEMKKRVAEAEANYAKEKKEFEECKKQLEDAKANLDNLKAQLAELEKKMTADTKLWVEQKTVRLHAAEEKRKTAKARHDAKLKAAEERMAEAQNTKAVLDKALNKEIIDHELAQKKLQKERAELEQAQKDLARATATLQKLRGYKPATSDPQPQKSSALRPSIIDGALLSAILLLSARVL